MIDRWMVSAPEIKMQCSSRGKLRPLPHLWSAWCRVTGSKWEYHPYHSSSTLALTAHIILGSVEKIGRLPYNLAPLSLIQVLLRPDKALLSKRNNGQSVSKVVAPSTSRSGMCPEMPLGEANPAPCILRYELFGPACDCNLGDF